MSGEKGFLNQFLKPNTPDPAPEVETPEAVQTQPIDNNPNEPAEPAEPVEEPTEPVQEQPTEPNIEEEEEPSEPAPTPAKAVELDDNQIIAYLKEKKGKEITSLEDLFKKEDVIDPFEGVSEEVQQFVKYNKETGRGLEDWNSLNTDYTKMSPLEVARQKVVQMTEGELKGHEINEFLEKKLNIDLSDPSNIERFDLVELKTFGKDFIESKIKEQETYKQPIVPKEEQNLVTLENGTKIPKEQYEAMEQQRQAYINNIKGSADKIKNYEFSVKVDNGDGSDLSYDLSYDYSKEDIHNMTSSALDIENSVAKMFTTKDGFDHKGLQEGLARMNPETFGKMVTKLVQQGIAKHHEEILRREENINLGQKKMPMRTGNKKIVPLPQGQTKGVVNTEIFKNYNP